MTNKGQLFALQEDLDRRPKLKKKEKEKNNTKKKKSEVMSKSSSADFYEDEQPILVNGPAQASESWASASFEADNNAVEEADYSVVSSYTNEENTYNNYNTYTQETPANYQSMSAGDDDQPSFLDELIQKPNLPNPDPL